MDINALISLANENIICGPECKKNEKSENLKKIYNDAKKNLINAPNKFNIAEKNYLIDSNGEDEYNNIMKNRKFKTINMMNKKLLEKHNQFVSDINGYLNHYNTNYVYYNRMDDIHKFSLKENKNYKQGINDYKSKMNVNNRKVFYEDKEMEHLHFIRIILLIIYFVVLFSILYNMNFIKNELYTNKYVLLLISLYVIFAIYVDYLPKLIYYIKIKMSYIFDNDVYVTM